MKISKIVELYYLPGWISSIKLWVDYSMQTISIWFFSSIHCSIIYLWFSRSSSPILTQKMTVFKPWYSKILLSNESHPSKQILAPNWCYTYAWNFFAWLLFTLHNNPTQYCLYCFFPFYTPAKNNFPVSGKHKFMSRLWLFATKYVSLKIFSLS